MEIIIFLMLAVLLFIFHGFITAPAVDENENLILVESDKTDEIRSERRMSA